MAKVLIMSGYGINSETESKYIFERAGAKADIVHINDLIGGIIKMPDYDIIMFPGGFSYGDDTGAGNAFANKLKNNLWEELLEFIDNDKLVLGVCNGFQIMANLGLFSQPYGEKKYALEPNSSNRFECRDVYIKSNKSKCIFTKNISIAHNPVCHGEGRFFCSNETLNELNGDNQTVFTYCDEEGKAANGKYPLNPNGSMADIAGICDKTGRIMGMMPHPERAFFSTSLPDYQSIKETEKREKKKIPELVEPNFKIFKNAVEFFKK